MSPATIVLGLAIAVVAGAALGAVVYWWEVRA